eukprot:SAG22_NODE_1322_length_4755_cov_49.468428_4_plen_134_part_00
MSGAARPPARPPARCTTTEWKYCKDQVVANDFECEPEYTRWDGYSCAIPATCVVESGGGEEGGEGGAEGGGAAAPAGACLSDILSTPATYSGLLQNPFGVDKTAEHCNAASTAEVKCQWLEPSPCNNLAEGGE